MEYELLWKSEGAHRLLYRTLQQISRRLGKRRSEYLTLDELESYLTLRDLTCVSPPTLWEKLNAWRSDDTFYKNISYGDLRVLKMKTINKKAENHEDLTEGELAYAFYFGVYTNGDCLVPILKKKVEGILEDAIIKPLIETCSSTHK